ncbi:transposase [Mycolicibacterium frederiksbergense]|uniref:transposase n=1 Tax=Mycolicibacterium frederiksbergense TaxID=117567 RepID=UPI003F4F5248
MTTKIHTAVDGNGRPLAVVVTGGQRNDGAMLAAVLDEIVVPRTGAGRVRTRPDAVIADRAYTSGVTRRLLRARKITAVIPQKRDEIAARARRGSAGGRPPATKFSTNSAISSNDHSRYSNNGAGLPPGTTNSPSLTVPRSSSAHASPEHAIKETRSRGCDQ